MRCRERGQQNISAIEGSLKTDKQKLTQRIRDYSKFDEAKFLEDVAKVDFNHTNINIEEEQHH